MLDEQDLTRLAGFSCRVGPPLPRAIAPPLSGRLSCRNGREVFLWIHERTVLDADSGMSEWRDHAGGGGQGSDLGPGISVRRLGVRGLPDVPGPVLAGGRAPGAVEAESSRAG